MGFDPVSFSGSDFFCLCLRASLSVWMPLSAGDSWHRCRCRGVDVLTKLFFLCLQGVSVVLTVNGSEWGGGGYTRKKGGRRSRPYFFTLEFKSNMLGTRKNLVCCTTPVISHLKLAVNQQEVSAMTTNRNWTDFWNVVISGHLYWSQSSITNERHSWECGRQSPADSENKTYVDEITEAMNTVCGIYFSEEMFRT